MMSVLTLVSGKEDRTLRRIRVSEIARNPNQPRKYFDPEAIAQLAESIRQYGVRPEAVMSWWQGREGCALRVWQGSTTYRVC